jgi:excisionase family DNA binding protein
MDTLLKPSDLARRLGVSRAWLYDAARQGRIPSVRIGGDDGPLRFIEEDVERWISDAREVWLPSRPPVGTRRRPAIRPRAATRDTARNLHS